MCQRIENEIHHVLIGETIVDMLAATFAHDQVFATKYP